MCQQIWISNLSRLAGEELTLVMVLRMASLSLAVGSPTYNILSNLPGRSTAGSMISMQNIWHWMSVHADIHTIPVYLVCWWLPWWRPVSWQPGHPSLSAAGSQHGSWHCSAHRGHKIHSTLSPIPQKSSLWNKDLRGIITSTHIPFQWSQIKRKWLCGRKHCLLTPANMHLFLNAHLRNLSCQTRIPSGHIYCLITTAGWTRT